MKSLPVYTFAQLAQPEQEELLNGESRRQARVGGEQGERLVAFGLQL